MDGSGRTAKVLRWQVAVVQFGGQREGSGYLPESDRGTRKTLQTSCVLVEAIQYSDLK